MKWDVLTLKGEQKQVYDLPDYMFGVSMNTSLVHQVLRAITLNRLSPVAHTKTRSEVRGGGRKPWRQKGTGRARHGSTRSPIWRKGGVTFGPRSDRDFSISINKKMKRKALFMVLSDVVQNKSLVIFDDISLPSIKTKSAEELLLKISKSPMKTLVVLPEPNIVVEKSMKNLPYVQLIQADSLNVEDVLKCELLITSPSSIEVMKNTYKV